VLAKNYTGYKNLVKLTTISHLNGMRGRGIFSRPCIDKSLLNKYVVIRTRTPAGSNLNEATNSGPALDTKGVMAAIEVPQRAKGSIIKNQLRIEFIRSADNLFKVVL